MISDLEKMNLFIAGDWDPIEKIIREEIAQEIESYIDSDSEARAFTLAADIARGKK